MGAPVPQVADQFLRTFVAVPVHQKTRKNVEVGDVVLHDLIAERISEQIVVVPFSHGDDHFSALFCCCASASDFGRHR